MPRVASPRAPRRLDGSSFSGISSTGIRRESFPPCARTTPLAARVKVTVVRKLKLSCARRRAGAVADVDVDADADAVAGDGTGGGGGAAVAAASSGCRIEDARAASHRASWPWS